MTNKKDPPDKGRLDEKSDYITQEDVLKLLFGDMAPYAHICSFADAPESLNNTQRGYWSGGYAKDYPLRSGNQFICVSIFAPTEKGKSRRRKAQFSAQHFLMLDDVGERTDPAKVALLPPATVELDSSLYSSQWFYKFDVPCTNQDMLDNLTEGMIAAGLTSDGVDPGMRNTTRYGRLPGPGSVNSKAKRVVENNGVAPDVKVTTWRPELTYSVEQLAAVFDIDLHSPRKQSRVDGATDIPDHPILKHLEIKSILSPGRYDIVCPKWEEHTGGDKTGTAAFTNDDFTIGFKCMHGSHQDSTAKDLLEWLGVEAKTEFKKWKNEKVTQHALASLPNYELDFIGDGARRVSQIENNKVIGEGKTKSPPKTDIVDIDEMLARFVLVAGGKRVVDRKYPRHDLTIDEWKLKYKASHFFTDGKMKFIADKWEINGKRITVAARTFKAGEDEFVLDPAGQTAINSWQPFERGEESKDVHLFTNHIAVLIPDKPTRERFLDWLAHIEQKPQELPHTAWIHIATNTGLGRNWLSSVLVRVWRGCVASNYNLVGSLDSDFNGALSGKILASVDEIREGGGSQWRHSEKIKSIITEETRVINPKYGRQSIEFNSCRWLIFSNHLSALPITSTDRRFEVVVNNEKPQSEEYYSELYKALEDDGFINGVALFLKARDLNNYNVGAHAIWSEDKLRATNVSKSETTEIGEALVKYWGPDIITVAVLIQLLNHDTNFNQNSQKISNAQKHALEELGIERLDKRARIGGKRQYLYTLRNHQDWARRDSSQVVSNVSEGGAPTGNHFDTNDPAMYLQAKEDGHTGHWTRVDTNHTNLVEK